MAILRAILQYKDNNGSVYVESSQCDDNQYRVAPVKNGNADRNLLWNVKDMTKINTDIIS